MARPAPIRLAGTIAATALCAALATEASAQSQGGVIVLNNQLQLGDVVAGVTLDVVDASQQVTTTSNARGTALSGGAEGQNLDVISTQETRGDVSADTTLTLRGDTEGRVTAVTQAQGSELSVGVYSARADVAAEQLTSGDVTARTPVTREDARLIGGGDLQAHAFGNSATMGGSAAQVVGSVDQRAEGDVRSSVRLAGQYVPGQAEGYAQAVGNAVTTTTGSTSHQNLTIGQYSAGQVIEADASMNAGNAWDIAARARAAGNRVHNTNQGGSQLAYIGQTNDSYVRSAATVTAFDYGQATAHAQGAGNEVTVGNNDIFVEIENSQFNTGGVDVVTEFQGGRGYDAYVGADAVGNSVTGYACSDCGGQVNATNSQVNQGDVSARATATVGVSGRATVVGANATGNAATFYVSRPGGH